MKKNNSGNCNSGYYNSGYCNSGNCNSGSSNSGYCNSGNCNTGNYNSGSYNTGFFCENTPTVILFDKDTGLSREDICIPYINLPLTEWIPIAEMSSKLVNEHPEAKTVGGVLIKRTYHEAWAVAWSKASEELKQQFKDLPNFCPDKFKRITGIDVRNKEGKCKMASEDILDKKIKATKACIEDEIDTLTMAISDKQWEEVQVAASSIEKLNYLLSHLCSIQNLIAKRLKEREVEE